MKGCPWEHAAKSAKATNVITVNIWSCDAGFVLVFWSWFSEDTAENCLSITRMFPEGPVHYRTPRNNFCVLIIFYVQTKLSPSAMIHKKWHLWKYCIHYKFRRQGEHDAWPTRSSVPTLIIHSSWTKFEMLEKDIRHKNFKLLADFK